MTCAYCGSAIVGLRPTCTQCGGPVGESRLKVRWGWSDPDFETNYFQHPAFDIDWMTRMKNRFTGTIKTNPSMAWNEYLESS